MAGYPPRCSDAEGGLAAAHISVGGRRPTMKHAPNVALTPAEASCTLGSRIVPDPQAVSIARFGDHQNHSVAQCCRTSIQPLVVDQWRQRCENGTFMTHR